MNERPDIIPFRSPIHAEHPLVPFGGNEDDTAAFLLWDDPDLMGAAMQAVETIDSGRPCAWLTVRDYTTEDHPATIHQAREIVTDLTAIAPGAASALIDAYLDAAATGAPVKVQIMRRAA